MSHISAVDNNFVTRLFLFAFFSNRCSLSDGSIPRWITSWTAGTVCFTVTGMDLVLTSLDREQDCCSLVQTRSRTRLRLTGIENTPK